MKYEPHKIIRIFYVLSNMATETPTESVVENLIEQEMGYETYVLVKMTSERYALVSIENIGKVPLVPRLTLPDGKFKIQNFESIKTSHNLDDIEISYSTSRKYRSAQYGDITETNSEIYTIVDLGDGFFNMMKRRTKYEDMIFHHTNEPSSCNIL